MSDDHTGGAPGEFSRSPAAVVESPSIFHPELLVSGIPAFEVKFVVPEPLAVTIEAALRPRLTPDPYADANLGGAYRVTTLYTETAAFDVYRRMGAYGRKKYRIRRYGDFDTLFLERKEKNGDRVRKHRIAVEEPGLARLVYPDDGRGEWSGDWFQRDLHDYRLAPICRITYDRRAFMGDSDSGVVRATFDRNIHGQLKSAWEVTPVRTPRELLPGQVVCEFKYRLAMPVYFKEIVERYGLIPTPCSKYRRFIDSSGIAPPPGGAGPSETGGPRDV